MMVCPLGQAGLSSKFFLSFTLLAYGATPLTKGLVTLLLIMRIIKLLVAGRSSRHANKTISK